MGIRIGQVTHYYSHLHVAVVELSGELNLGDRLLLLGHSTDFEQVACSLEIEHHKIISASQGMEIALKVDEVVRLGDEIFKVGEEGEHLDNRTLWKSLQALEEQLGRLYEPTLSAFATDHGIDLRMIGTLVAAVTYEPGTISPEEMLMHSPYQAETAFAERLHAAEEKGLLFEPDPGEFCLTGEGRALIVQVLEAARLVMARADPLPLPDSQTAVYLLGRLVETSLSTPPPPETLSVILGYRLMPAEDPPLPYIEQAISCLFRYRDDAHIAAWKASRLSAPALESLTLLWRGEAQSLDGLLEHLSMRGHEPHVYQDALAELAQRGLIEGEANALSVTPAGRSYRHQVEHDTDRFFYAPWKCLEPDDKLELACLVSRLRDGLRV
jgi:hypothetical protein